MSIIDWQLVASDLEQQVAALTKERDVAMTATIERGCNETTRRLEEQLAASKAREKKLREALEEANALNVNWVSVAEVDMLEHLSEYKAVIKMGTEALAIQQDDTALQARLKEERVKVLREAATKVNGYWNENKLICMADELERSMT